MRMLLSTLIDILFRYNGLNTVKGHITIYKRDTDIIIKEITFGKENENKWKEF